MILSNFHTHTPFCDGINTACEHIDAAIALGFHSLGFSGHGYVPFEGLFRGMSPEAAAEYRESIGGLKTRYAGRLNIYMGLENDSSNMQPAEPYDYTIGSVHCIELGGRYYSVDSRDTITNRTIRDEFGGDGLAYAITYFEAVLEFAREKRADILGHMDLVRRFNAKENRAIFKAGVNNGGDGGRFFDERDPRYRRAAEAALEQAVHTGYIIEVNTAPLSKGFSNEPYPSLFLLEAARELGARIIVGSDAHEAKNLNYAFDSVEAALRKIGFKERWELTPGGFEPVKL